MNLFHKHKYILKDDRTLWCECGSFKVLPCEHIWEETDYVYSITNNITGKTRDVGKGLKCKKCGELTLFSVERP